MANFESKLGVPLSTDCAIVSQTSLQFINEMERKQNPKSHLRAVVRSNARRSSYFKRRAEDTANSSSLLFKKLQSALECSNIVGSAVELDAASFSGEPPNESENPPPSRSNFVQFNPQQAKRPRSRKCNEKKKLEVQAYEYLSSQAQKLSRRTRHSGEEHPRQQWISPETILGAGRIDPFNYYPI
jgi:hypothetical protein